MLMSILPTPLHPALVHLPIALTVLVPLFALGALVHIHRGGRVLRSWGLATAMLAALSASALLALKTGEADEETVESIVPEVALEQHEDAGARFLYLSLGVLGLAAVGLAGGRLGGGARYATAAGTLMLVAAGYSVGHTGGALVYRYNAASGHVRQATDPGAGTKAHADARDRDGGDRDE